MNVDEAKKLRIAAITNGSLEAYPRKKRLHWLLITIIILNRIFVLRQKKPKVLHGERLAIIRHVDRPMIFCPTHNGNYDIQILGEVIRKFHWVLLSGDHNVLPGTMQGNWLAANGVIYLDRDDKIDRQTAKLTAIKLLQMGLNLMIYPEGTWNISENHLVLDLFMGIIEIARQSNALIVPFGLETVTDKKYIVNIGDFFDVFAFDDSIRAIQALRDEMASLKWEILEKEISMLTSPAREARIEFSKYIEQRMNECPYMNEELIRHYARKNKNTPPYHEVFSHLSSIACKQNAFLYHHEICEANDRFETTLFSKTEGQKSGIDSPFMEYRDYMDYDIRQARIEHKQELEKRRRKNRKSAETEQIKLHAERERLRNLGKL